MREKCDVETGTSVGHVNRVKTPGVDRLHCGGMTSYRT